MVQASARPGLSQATQALAIVLVLITVASIIGVSVVRGSQYMYAAVTAAMGLVILIRPAWGMVGYLILAATLPSSGTVGSEKVATFALLAWMFMLATIRLLRYGPSLPKSVRVVITSVYILFVAIGISLLVALGNDIRFVDWARDVFPPANLAIVAIMAAFIRHDRDIRMLKSVFIGLCAYIGASGVASLLGLPFFSLPLIVGGTWIHAILVSIAAASLSEFSGFRPKYLAMGVLGVLTAFTSDTRTIWVGLLVVVVVSLITNLRAGRARRNIVIVLFVVVVSATAYGVASNRLGAERWAAQQERFGTLERLQQDPSYLIRQEQRREAYGHFFEHPAFGVGLGYQYHYNIEFTEKYEEGTNFNHSDFANYLCKMGLAGTAAIAWVFLAVLLLCNRIIRQARDPEDRWFARTAQISLLAGVVMANSTPIMQVRETTFILSFLVAVVVLVAIRVERAGESPTRAPLETELASAARPRARQAPGLP